MPIVASNYKPNVFFRNGHFSTIYSGLFRRVGNVNQQRERIALNDGDFLDLDWSYSKNETQKLIIVLHGLEGNAQRPYILGVAKVFNDNGFDAVCVNFRGCSGEANNKYRSYHSGATEDLVEIINTIVSKNRYDSIALNGFSLGGNMMLKYLGEEHHHKPKEIKSAVAVSVPCHLNGSCKELHKLENFPYANMFKKNLIRRLKEKQKRFPDKVSIAEISSIKTLKDFDDIYTSRAHGFKNALDYYEQCSSLQFLHNIKIPVLLINALDDSFLSEECFPYDISKSNEYIFMETPKYGGHVGFYDASGVYYNEKRALNFVNKW